MLLSESHSCFSYLDLESGFLSSSKFSPFSFAKSLGFPSTIIQEITVALLIFLQSPAKWLTSLPGKSSFQPLDLDVNQCCWCAQWATGACLGRSIFRMMASFATPIRFSLVASSPCLADRRASSEAERWLGQSSSRRFRSFSFNSWNSNRDWKHFTVGLFVYILG